MARKQLQLSVFPVNCIETGKFQGSTNTRTLTHNDTTNMSPEEERN